jgi:hypothetical protein
MIIEHTKLHRVLISSEVIVEDMVEILQRGPSPIG